jgi:hypothetical protein
VILGHDDDVRLRRASAKSVNYLAIANLKPTRKVLAQEASKDLLLDVLPLCSGVVKRRPYLRQLGAHLLFDGGYFGP